MAAEPRDTTLAVTTGRKDATPLEDTTGFVVLPRTDGHSASVRWAIAKFSTRGQGCLWSKYFDVGGYDCRVLVYPSGTQPCRSGAPAPWS